MSKQKNKGEFNAMNVAELKKFLQERRVSVSGYFENFAGGNRLCSRKNGFANGSKLQNRSNQ